LNGQVDRQFTWGLIGTRERPVAADMNMDGIDDIGLWNEDRTGVAPTGGSEWYFLISGAVAGQNGGLLGPSIINRIEFDASRGQNVVRYTPTPFGNDEYIHFGDQFAKPIVGNFDPPVSGSATTTTNFGNPYDVDGNSQVNLDDLLRLIYEYSDPARRTTFGRTGTPFVDVNRDGKFDIDDILNEVYGYQLYREAGLAEGESVGTSSSTSSPDHATATDAVFAEDALFDIDLDDDES
jgi:hypothetical protein